MSPLYKNTEWYGVSGPSWQTARDVFQKLGELEAANHFFHVYDAYFYGVNDYVYNDFFNQHHLSEQGAGKLSVRVNRIIDSLLNR
jgi:hypothetical protein